MSAVVREVLRYPEGRKWQVQGLGMLRTYLLPTLRLHVWDRVLRVPEVSTIHDHPWDFESLIVSGRVVQRRFTEVAETRAQDAVIEMNRTKIKCGPGGCAVSQPDRVKLLVGVEEVYGPGETYRQAADEVHESTPDDGTVTLVERTFLADTEHARVYHEGRWVSAEPRPATPEEVALVVGRALLRWSR